MDILNTLTFKSNRQIKINFDGGDLFSKAGLFLIKGFAVRIGFSKLIKKKFKTNDKPVCFHKDDCVDELTLVPVFNGILEKDSLAS